MNDFIFEKTFASYKYRLCLDPEEGLELWFRSPKNIMDEWEICHLSPVFSKVDNLKDFTNFVVTCAKQVIIPHKFYDREERQYQTVNYEYRLTNKGVIQQFDPITDEWNGCHLSPFLKNVKGKRDLIVLLTRCYKYLEAENRL